MFLSKVPAWKTRVEYGRITAMEHGAIDPEKIAQFSQMEKTEAEAETKEADQAAAADAS